MADGIIWHDCDVTFDMVLKPADGSAEQVIVTFTHHFATTTDAGGHIDLSTAVPFEASADAPRVEVHPGDQLLWRHHVSGTTASPAYAPDGDGPTNHGRFPFIDIPAYEPTP